MPFHSSPYRSLMGTQYWTGALQQGAKDERWSLTARRPPSHRPTEAWGAHFMPTPQSPVRTPLFYALNARLLLQPGSLPNTIYRAWSFENGLRSLRSPRLLTWSPRICGGLFTTSFTRCSTVSVCRVPSAQIRSTRAS